MDQTLNANVANCLQTANHFGFTRVHNVCSGTITDVPWGTADIALGIVGGAFILSMVLIFAAMFFVIVRESW